MVADLLAAYAEANSGASAVIVDAYGGAQPSATSFGELNALVNRLANAFDGLGTERGDRMVWCGPNSLEVLVTLHAARKAGLTAVPLSYRFSADEMAYVIENSDATLVIVDAEQAPALASVSEDLSKVQHFVVYGGDAPPGFLRWDEVIADSSDAEPPDAPDATSGSSMIYTSGTTGKPKGALRTTTDPETVYALLAELGLRLGEEIHLTTGPMYHSGPLAFATMSHTMGCPVVVLRKFDATAWLRLVKEHRITNTFTAPTQLKRIVSLSPGELERADVSSMRCLIANAAPVPYALKQELIEKLGDGFLYEVYGSTELGVVTVLKPEDQLRKPGSCGQTYGPIEVRIVREDGSEAGADQPGELFIRTRLAMDGYHRSSEQLSELDDDGDARGWKSVGDVASVDDEGYLSIRDRLKDMIISGGVNIYPAEIEAVLYAHPQIIDAAVFGIPDDEWGESVYAVVQAKVGESIDLDELATFVDERLGGYKRPRGYELRDELPRTDAGKLLKRVLRDEFWVGQDRRV